jgi:diamine N-acetyltransferase
MEIKLRVINKNNYREVCELYPGKLNEKFIEKNHYSLLEFIYHKYKGECKAIYYNDKLVGFLMITEIMKPIYIHRFMIDEKFQNKGIGTKSFKYIINYIKQNYNVKSILLSTDNPIAKSMYLKLGFKLRTDKKGKEYFKKHKEELMELVFLSSP